MKKLLLLFGLLVPAITLAQQYTIDWYKIAGGGGTSTGGTYQVSGTIGQPDASGTTSGGNYTLTGGFWSLIAVVQTAGAPTLTITHVGNSESFLAVSFDGLDVATKSRSDDCQLVN